jgi:hypothetical protein
LVLLQICGQRYCSLPSVALVVFLSSPSLIPPPKTLLSQSAEVSVTTKFLHLVANVPQPHQKRASSEVLLVCGHLQLHLPPMVHTHAHGSTKPYVDGVITVCFPRQQNTTDLPWAWMTCCTSRHIRFTTACTRAHHLSISWASSVQSMPSHPIS